MRGLMKQPRNDSWSVDKFILFFSYLESIRGIIVFRKITFPREQIKNYFQTHFYRNNKDCSFRKNKNFSYNNCWHRDIAKTWGYYCRAILSYILTFEWRSIIVGINGVWISKIYERVHTYRDLGVCFVPASV